MSEKTDCIKCALFLCGHNKYPITKSDREAIDRGCFITVIQSKVPVYCHTCVVSRDKTPLKKLEETIHALQKAEGNPQCFTLRNLCKYLYK